MKYADFTNVLLGEDSGKIMKRIISRSRSTGLMNRSTEFSGQDSWSETRLSGRASDRDNIRVRDGRERVELVRRWVKEGDCCVAFFEAQPKTAEFGLDIVRIE